MAEANPSNYVLLSIEEEIGADKNGGDKGSAGGADGGGTAIAENLTRLILNSNLTASGGELADKKAERNRGRGRGGGTGHPPTKVRFYKSRLMEKMAGREADRKDDNIMGDMEYPKRKGGSVKARKGINFTLRAQTQMRHLGKILFVPPSLLIGPVLFRFCTK